MASGASGAMKLSKADVRKGLVSYQLQRGSVIEVIERLRSVQYDPLSPAGCNHDLVLQARVNKYKIGEWQTAAYKKRQVYDGWDKQACLVPFTGWGIRRVFHEWHRPHFEKVLEEDSHAIEAVLKELERHGPMSPKDFEFQERRDEWHGSWYGPSLTKRALRALWHTGRVMTTKRKGQQHVYDLTERVVPAHVLAEPLMSEDEMMQAILLERHKAMGLIRPPASFEVWSMHTGAPRRKAAIGRLIDQGELIEVDIEGIPAVAVPEFLEMLGKNPGSKVTFIAPLDQIMWDRKMIQLLFGFEYLWEVYVPESQRRWGYYVLPVLFEDRFVARFDVWARAGVVEIRAWHWESGKVPARFWPAFEKAMLRFMDYCGADQVVAPPGADQKLKECLDCLSRG